MKTAPKLKNVETGKNNFLKSDAEIETTKFFLHEGFCARTYLRCKECNEVVEIIMIDEHKKQKHTDFPCPLCKRLFKKVQLKDHAEVCERRLRQCIYCELEVEDCEMGVHMKVCGNKTDNCNFCFKTFYVKELNGHYKLCDKNPEKKKKNEQKFEDFSYLDEDYGLSSKNNIPSDVNLEKLDSVTEDLIKQLQYEDDLKLAAEM